MQFRIPLASLVASVALAAGLSVSAEEAPAYKVAHVEAPKPAKPVRAAKPKAAKLAAAPAATPTVEAVVVRARPAPTEREISVLFDLWNAALQTGSPDLVASLYAPDAVLLPTVSNRVRTTRYEITDYFQHFLALQPRGTVNQSFIRILGPDLAMNAGVYTFDVVRDGKPEQVTARFDFLYKRVDGRWLIVDHHSSKMPEPLDSAPVQHAAVH